MGWENAHLHQFIVGKTYFGEPDLEYGYEMESERRAKVGQVAPAVRSKFVYEYDFGDGWDHQIVVEKLLPAEPGVRYPRCLAGERAYPPEDCGGVWGYADLLEILQDPEHPEYEERMEWLGDEFDPELFDLEAVNRALRRIP